MNLDRSIDLASIDESSMWACEMQSSPQCRGAVELRAAFKLFDGRSVSWACDSCYMMEVRSWVTRDTPNLLEAVRLAKAIRAGGE